MTLEPSNNFNRFDLAPQLSIRIESDREPLLLFANNENAIVKLPEDSILKVMMNGAPLEQTGDVLDSYPISRTDHLEITLTTDTLIEKIHVIVISIT